MKIPVPVVLAIAALSFAALSCGDAGTYASLKISASPTTFKSVGEVISLTYTVDAGDYIDRSKSQGVADDAADMTPSCSVPEGGKQLICKATHTITEEDIALGYVTSSAKFSGYISPSMGGFVPLPSGKSEYLIDNETLVIYIENFTPSPTPTITPLTSPTPTVTVTPTLTPTPTATFTSTPPASVEGEVQSDLLSCRYGPGASYLYYYGLAKGAKVEIIGKAETAGGLWLYVNFTGGKRPCWVNSKYIQTNGDASAVQSVYPENAPLILFHHDKFPPVTNVSASRSGDQVEVSWVGYELALGDRESAESPQYLVEFWTCQAGQIVFTAYGAFEQSAVIQDQAGCSEPSHGQVYIAHKDGYIGPVAIPWPAQ